MESRHTTAGRKNEKKKGHFNCLTIKSEVLRSTVIGICLVFFFSLPPPFDQSHVVFSGWAWLSLFCWSLAQPSSHLAHINPHHLRLPRPQLWCLFHYPINTIYPGQQKVSLLFRKRETQKKKTRQGGKNMWQRKGEEKKGLMKWMERCRNVDDIAVWLYLSIYASTFFFHQLSLIHPFCISMKTKTKPGYLYYYFILIILTVRALMINSMVKRKDNSKNKCISLIVVFLPYSCL